METWNSIRLFFFASVKDCFFKHLKNDCRLVLRREKENLKKILEGGMILRIVSMSGMILFSMVPSVFAHTQMNFKPHLLEDCQKIDDVEEKTDFIRSLVAFRQLQVENRFNQGIELKFTSSCLLQAQGGHDFQSKIVLVISRGILAKLNRAEIAAVTCHELGHILGSVTLADTGETSMFNKLDSVEGEADYYAGKCLLNALNKDFRLAEETFKTLFSKLYRTDAFNLEQAARTVFTMNRGINSTYPNQDCRLWSSISGLYGLERPKCWYNPID